MFFRMLYDDKLAQAAYLIGCQRTGEAIVIDPERDVDRYIDVAAREKLRIVAAAETHIHADFLSGGRELAERGATVYLSDEGDVDWKYQWLDKKTGGGAYAHRLLKDGDTFRVGNIEFRVLHTPGHTPEHICFLVTDLGGGASQPMGILTGDFVFVGDVGRPDLLESAAGFANVAAPSARRLYESIRRFAELPDYLQVWPAHGAGSACGKALGAVPQSTVGYEKRFNASLLAAENERKFVDFILEGQPEPPLYFARMKRDNKIGPRVLGELPRPRRLSAADLATLDARKVALIDTRPWAIFREAHVPGSLFHPLTSSFNTDAGSMIDEHEDIDLVVEPARLEEAVRDLIRVGLDRIVGWIPPEVVEEHLRSGRAAAAPEVGVDKARELIAGGGAFVLDVRRASEFSLGRIPGARNIAHTRLASRLAEVPRDRPVLVNCRSGARSASSVALLRKNGFDAINLGGGILAWEQAAAPVER